MSPAVHLPEIFRMPLAIPFWIVFFLAFVREGRILRGAFQEPPAAQDAGTFRALMIGSPLALLAAVIAACTPWLLIPWPQAAVILGMFLLVAGAVLRRRCFAALGDSFTGAVIVRAEQRVIRHGPYRWVRHPSYSAAFLLYLGIGLALGSWLSVVILFLAHCYLYGLRIRAEERALLATLGEPYRQYMAQTRRLVPFIY